MSGQFQHEFASFAKSAGHAERASVQRRNFPTEGKPQPCSAAVSNGIHTIESFKNMGKIRFGNADSVIANRNSDAVWQCLRLYPNLPAFAPVFYGIFNQIEDHLRKKALIRNDSKKLVHIADKRNISGLKFLV